MASDEPRLVRLELPRDREVLRLFHRAYDEENGFDRDPAAHDRLFDDLARQGDMYHCLILYVGQSPAGYMRAYDRLSTSSAGRVLMLDIVHLLPQWRGRGLGRVMIEGLIGFARRRGHARIDLLVDLDNQPARRLYEGCGFVGRRRLQMHRWIRDDPQLEAYFQVKQRRDG